MILFFILGVICFLYYFVIAVCAKRFDTTFSGFWVALGIFFLILGKIWGFLPFAAQVIAGVVTAALFLFFLAVESKIAGGMTKKVPEDLEILIILGAHVRGTKVTDSLKRRIDRAAEYAKAHKETILVVSGGQGTGEDISEALAMKRYLVKAGIAEERVLMEDQSTNTYENLRFSSRLIADYQDRKVGIVTNNFHIYRALQLAKSAGYQAYGVPASTKPVVLPNYMAREFFAEIKRWLYVKSAR